MPGGRVFAVGVVRFVDVVWLFAWLSVWRMYCVCVCAVCVCVCARVSKHSCFKAYVLHKRVYTCRSAQVSYPRNAYTMSGWAGRGW